jgi:two-component system, OmpR family, copper resistance phosphate regulon response regulator CusR
MKILLVEDEQRVSAFIRKGLEEASYHVTLAYDGEYGSKLAIQHSYDLIILDIILPGKSGLDVCKELRKDEINTPILMLTALGTVDDKVTGLDVGADDYLVKPFHFKELLARVNALTRRQGKITHKTVYRVGDLEMNTETKKVTRGGKQIKLTAKEFRLLEVLLKHRGRVLSRTEIAQYVWDISFDTGTNVIDVYINYLRNKIDKGHSLKLLRTVVGMGYTIDKDLEG